MHEKPRPWQSSWIVLPVLVLAAWLRLWNLPARGLLYWDEGKFALEGLRLLGGLQELLGAHGSMAAGKAVGTAKPTHALLIALSYAALGIHDYSPLILSALCSTATVAVIYFLARRLFDPATALIAAILLAVSGYDVLYARSALSESDANLLFTSGVLLWSLAWRRDVGTSWQPGRFIWRLSAALILGLSFTTNYRLAIYSAVVVVLDLALLARQSGPTPILKAATLWAAGFAAFPLLWDAVGLVVHAGGATLFASEIRYRRTTYLAEALYQLHGGKQSVFHFNPAPYVQWYAVRQSLPMTLLLLAGLALAAARRTTSLLVPALLVAFPYVVFVFAPFIVPRNLDTAIPFAVLLTAAGLVFAAQQVRASAGTRVAALVVATLTLTLACCYPSWRMTAIRSGFAQAAGFLGRQHQDGAVVSNEVMMFYLMDAPSACDAARLPRRISGLGADPYGYAVVDVYNSQARRYLLSHGRRVARFLVAGTQSLGENPVASENGLPPGPHQDQHVDVYRLPVPRARDAPHARSPACNPNKVV